VSKYVDLIAELITRGYSDEDVVKVMGKNLIRAFKEAENVAEVLTRTEYPSEAVISLNYSDYNCRTM
jgi:membrane dipeptidase